MRNPQIAQMTQIFFFSVFLCGPLCSSVFLF
jgi:hypothetical protein